MDAATTTTPNDTIEIWYFGAPLRELTDGDLAVVARRAWNLSDMDQLELTRPEQRRRGIPTT